MSWLIRRIVFLIAIWGGTANLAWAQFSDEFEDLPPAKPPVRTLPSLPPSGGAPTNSASPSIPAAPQTDQGKNFTPPRSGSQELPTPLPPMEGRDFPTLERRGPEDKLAPGIQFEDPVPSLGRPVESIRDLPAKKAGQFDITLDGGASINPAVLKDVRDSTLGLKVEDREAYFRILKLASLMSFPQLQELAIEYRKARIAAHDSKAATEKKFSPFVDLFLHPEVYRGKPVVLRGTLRKLVKYDPGPNDEGLTTVYEGWLYSADSQNNPTVVVFTQKPEGMPLGGDLVEEVVVAGYFFKMYGYEAQDQPRKAPMLLAGEIEWIPPIQKTTLIIPVWAYGIAGLVAVWIMLGLWTFRSEKRRLPEKLRVPGNIDQTLTPHEQLLNIAIPPSASSLELKNGHSPMTPSIPGNSSTLPTSGLAGQGEGSRSSKEVTPHRRQDTALGFPENPRLPEDDEPS